MQTIINLNGTLNYNQTGLLSLVQGMNQTLMFGQLGNLLLLGLFAVMLIAFYTNTGDLLKSVSGASFISFIFAISLSAMSLANSWTILVTMIATGVCIAMSFKNT